MIASKAIDITLALNVAQIYANKYYIWYVYMYVLEHTCLLVDSLLCCSSHYLPVWLSQQSRRCLSDMTRSCTNFALTFYKCWYFCVHMCLIYCIYAIVVGNLLLFLLVIHLNKYTCTLHVQQHITVVNNTRSRCCC